MHQPKQLQLFDFPSQPQIKAVHDPYWDKLEAQADDIVEQAFLSINTEDEILASCAEIACSTKYLCCWQISFDETPYKCVGPCEIRVTNMRRFLHMNGYTRNLRIYKTKNRLTEVKV